MAIKITSLEQLKYFYEKLKSVFVKKADLVSLAENPEFITALAQNETFVEEVRNQIGLATAEKNGLVPQLPEE